MKEIISKEIEKNWPMKASERVIDDFHSFLKDQDYDKKEIVYCKKMLFMKRNQKLGFLTSNPKELASKLVLNPCLVGITREVEIEGEVTNISPFLRGFSKCWAK